MSDDQQLQHLTEQVIAATQPDTDQLSSNIIQVDTDYLDGQFDLPLLIRRCQQAVALIGQNYLNLGRDLLVIREHCEHGQFLQALNAIGIGKRMAYNSIQIAVKYNHPKLQYLAERSQVNYSKLLALAAEPDDELETLLDGGSVAGLQLSDIERMSAADLRKELQKARKKLQESQESHDRVITEKNAHADDLAKRLADLQGRPRAERWPEIIDCFKNDFTAFGSDAEKILARLLHALDAMPLGLSEETPESARKSAAMQALAQSNQLTNLVAELQFKVYAEFAEFIQQPTYTMGDPLVMMDDEKESS